MAISDNYAPDKSSGNGVTVAFSGNWNTISADYFRLYWEDKTTGVQTLKTKGTHYTLAFTSSGYTATHDPLYIPPSTVWVIRARDIAKDQTDPYKTSTGFQGKVIEDSFDKLTAITQDQQDQLDRSPKLALGSSTVLLPMEEPIAGKGLMWNATEDGIINSDDDLNGLVADAEAAAAAAAASAAAASGSASAASASASSASNSASNAATSETNAATSASTATTQAGIATTQAGIATTQASNAATSASTATTQAGIATTQASNAATSASTATTQAGIATAQAAIAVSAAGFTYTYDSTTTASDPGSGKLRFNNATIASATALYISETTGLAQAIAAEIATWDDSTSTIHTKLHLFKQSDPATFVIFSVTGTLTDNGSWDTLTVAYVTGSGSIANNDLLTIQSLRTGDKGDTGAAGTLMVANAGGTVDAITADFTPDVSLADNVIIEVVSAGANTITNPTLNTDTTGALTIKSRGNAALIAGDTGLAGYTMQLRYEATGTYWELQNPAKTIESDLALSDNTTANFSTSKHGLVPKGTNVGNYLKDDGTWAAVTGMSCVLNAQASSYTLIASDLGKLVDFTGSSDQTWAFTAAATLATGWFCYIRNNGTSNAVITLDPNSSELIDGLTSFPMYPGEERLVQCTGSAFNSIILKGFNVRKTATFTFINPPGYKSFKGFLWGSGASGGKGATNGGGGGGGGACLPFDILSSKIGAAGTSTTVTIGAGGSSQASANSNGNAGNSSTFGTFVTSYGGGRGGGATGGGGGGGAGTGYSTAGAAVSGIGSNATTSTAGTGGIGWSSITTTTAGVFGLAYNGGGGSGASTPGGGAIYGGGGGSGGFAAGAAPGGASVWGGGGGGGADATTAGTGGPSTYGGVGGAGGIGANNATGGTAPSGGGGGSVTGNSGAGGDGGCEIQGIV